MPEYTTHLTVTQEAETMEEADERLGAALDRHWLAIATWTTVEARNEASAVEGGETS